MKLQRNEWLFYLWIAILTVLGIAMGVGNWVIVGSALLASVVWFSYVSGELKKRDVRWRDVLTRRSAASSPSPYVVTCTEDAISVTFDGKAHGEVRWTDVIMVGIRIDDSFLPQPWWVVGGVKGGLWYPSDAIGWEVAHKEMTNRLPGFDNRAVIQAAGMMAGGVVVWEATPNPAT